MQDFKAKYKRQVEILGICLSQNYPSPLKTFDLADMFGVEELTIKRDLQDLRSSGIDIHSEKKYGVRLSRKLDDNKIRELIQQYSVLNSTDKHIEKSTGLLVTRLGEKALANMVTLQMCIEKGICARIDYEKESEELEFGREIQPVLIFQSEHMWRVLAISDGKMKQFLLIKIIEVRETSRHFKKIDNEKIEDIFKYSWRSWLGQEKINVKLKFSPVWTERLRPKPLMEYEKTELNPDGSMVYETIVNSLDEIASWIVSRGEGVVVLEPAELKEKVIRLANETLNNYQK
jgi:predicted DNA-binding transcriptional regulator YafY